MNAIEYRLPQDFNKSFIVFEEKGEFFPCTWHYHTKYELVLVVKSTGRRIVGDHIGCFQDGDLVFMAPALPHVWVNDAEYIKGQANHLADAIVIHFHEKFIEEGFMDFPEMEPLINFLNLSSRGMVIKGGMRKKASAIIENMLHMNGLQRLASLFEIFDILSNGVEYELLASPGYVNRTQLNDSDQFSKITEYVMRNFDRDIPLREIASVANMGLTTFCNFFKKHYGITYVEYLHSVRIGHACKLLSEKSQNIAQVAYACGFNNLGNFNRQFKKIKKMTPREYCRTTRAIYSPDSLTS